MSSLKIVNALKKQKSKLLLLIFYCPISCCLIGILAYYMRCPSPVIGSYPFIDVFWFYANPLNSSFSSVHLPTLILSVAFLLLMIISANTSKPVITIFHIRVILLTLIVIITLLAKIFLNIEPYIKEREYAFMNLFLFVDVDLILVYLLTFLPFFRRPKANLLKTKTSLKEQSHIMSTSFS